jgi:hypothetical protein
LQRSTDSAKLRSRASNRRRSEWVMMIDFR